MIGLIQRALRDSLSTTAFFALGLFLLETLLAFVIPNIADEMGGAMLRIEFVRTLFSALIGADVASAGSLMTEVIPWVHPVILATLWAQQIVHSTRFPVGEIDRATVDLWMTLPVSRTQIYVAEGIGFVLSGLGIVLAIGLGNSLGHVFAGGEQLPLGQVILVMVNILLVHTAIGGFGYMISAMSDHRGRAVGAVFCFVLVSFVINFLGPFWAPAKSIAFLSFLEYYRPVGIFRDTSIPTENFLVLGALSCVCWTIGLGLFVRRDIHTL